MNPPEPREMTIPESEINDLEDARGIIAALRAKIGRLREEIEEWEAVGVGEITIFLDDEHHQKALLLYEAQTPHWASEKFWYTNPEFDEVFTDFVQGAIDWSWDTTQDLMKDPPKLPKIVASA